MRVGRLGKTSWPGWLHGDDEDLRLVSVYLDEKEECRTTSRHRWCCGWR